MLQHRLICALVAFFCIILVQTPPAHAQGTNHWMAAAGDDSNPCSRTAPCRTLQGAINKSSDGSLIMCIDAADYGPAVIRFSVDINCGGMDGAQGFVEAHGGDALTIDAAAPLSVTITNLTIVGDNRTGGSSLSGIKILSGGSLGLTHVSISGFGGTGGTNGGIDIEPRSNETVVATDVDVVDGSADCVLIKPQDGADVVLAFVRSACTADQGAGLDVDTRNSQSGSGVQVAATQCSFTGNSTGVVAWSANGSAPAGIALDLVLVSDSSVAGVQSTGAASTVRTGRSTVSGNASAFVATGGGVVVSYGDNYVVGNASSDVGSLSHASRQ